MNTNLDMDWIGNQGLNDSDLMNIASECGYDITIGANNGEEIRRANQTKPWPNDQEINGIDSTSNNSDKHKYIDLGLPSGTLWATENIKDANGNELYFAWGETQGYTAEQVGTDKYFAYEGVNADYKYGTYDGSDKINCGMTKYNKTDGKTELDAEDDAATANWGSDWKIPTKEQFDELAENTTIAWTQVGGVDGMVFTSTANENTLFLPAAGFVMNGAVSDVGNYGDYWSASVYGENVGDSMAFYTADTECGTARSYRCFGCSVRPVRVSN